jgi:hypothetical protein
MIKKFNNLEILTESGWCEFEGIKKIVNQPTYKITLENEKAIICTFEHIFFDESGQLKICDAIVGLTNIKTTDGFKRIIDIRPYETEDVFDILEVKNSSNSFIANDIITHNCQFQGSTVTLIDADVIINKLKWSEPMLQPDDFTKVWQMPKSGRRYVICIDTGGGVGSDYSIMNVFDITEFPNEPAEQVAIWKNNKTPPNEFADVLKAACEYWNDAYTIGETNGLSAEVLSRLFNDYEYENIFMDMENGGTFGVFSTRKSKPVAALNFKELLEKGLIILHDSETIDEIGIFEEVSPGVFKAKTGKDLHDDCVITCLWLGYFLRSSYFEDEKSMWGNENGYSKQFSEDADEYNEDANIEAIEAFLEADKKENGDDWLEQDEHRAYRY